MTMTKKYDLIIFDWDGTLMDSVDKIVRCMTAAAGDLGVADPGTAAIRHIIGLGLTEAMQALFPALDPEIYARLTERYREHFLHLDQTHMPLFPGVNDGLQQLSEQDYLLAVATGKARRGLERVLEETATRRFFSATRCADESFSKPHPKMLEDILEATGVVPQRALMVGDTTYDMQMAQNAGVAGLGVSYGVHPRDDLLQHGALACLDTFDAVCAWIR
jgi:phosphoglycolate phosphatase